jgi:LacI family transcriptional regulator
VTLKDVARRAGVHAGTASRALNEATRSLVKGETAERVASAAAELGYRPDYLARSFKTRRTLSVGIVIPDINNPLFPPMVRGIEDRLLAAGYVALLANTENDPEREELIVDQLLARRMDGLVLATAKRYDPRLADLQRHGIELVLANRVSDDPALPSVAVDDLAGSCMVVEHVAALGHRLVAHVAGPQSVSTGKGRYAGFLVAMARCGLEVPEERVAFADSFSIEEGQRRALQLLSRDPRPTAVVAANDMLALGCYTALAELGLSCPGDVSVTGFNDMPFMDRLNPPLTTVRVPQYELGWKAAELLLERIAHPGSPPKSIRLGPKLVVRGSTGRAPAVGERAAQSA